MLSTNLNKENVAKWAEALRSGKYEQGNGALRDPDGRYCCLGVACEVIGRPLVPRPFIEDGSLTNDYSAVRSWLGATAEEEGVFISLNDRAHKSFSEIADYAEALADGRKTASYVYKEFDPERDAGTSGDKSAD